MIKWEKMGCLGLLVLHDRLETVSTIAGEKESAQRHDHIVYHTRIVTGQGKSFHDVIVFMLHAGARLFPENVF